jgi:hypothetical protein
MDKAVLERAVKALADLNAKPHRQSEPSAQSRAVAKLEAESPEPKQTPWPAASLEAEQRFGQSHARLFPFIHKRVWTPAGIGILLSVFLEQCEILPDSAEKTIRVQTGDVKPIH